MIKYVYAGLAALFILTAGVSYSRADLTVSGDAPKACPATQIWDAAKAQLEANDTKVVQLNAEMIKSMNGKMGPPPHSNDQPFDAFMAEKGDLAAVFVVQNNCAIDRLGPGPVEIIKAILGITGA